jgi:hypothetical protein
MFPNVRLMVVAILAAITGIGCGLGLFATFRVNHEPLARLAEGSPPLQLAVDNRALGSDARASLEARLPANGAAKLISVPVIIATPSLALERSGADSAIAGDSSVQQTAASVAAEDKSDPAKVAIVEAVEQSGVTPEAPGRQEAVAAAPDQQHPAAAASMAPPPEQTAAINAAAPNQQPAAKPTKSGESKAAKRAAKATRAPPVRRAAKTVRARRTAATVAAQPTYQYPQATYSQPTYSQPTYSQPTYSQSTYTWADGTTQAVQPVRRVQIKRHRAAKKTAPAAQSNPSTATAGLGGTQ